MKNVVVIGGGFSGLVTAYYLAKQGHSVELYEASSRLGGMLSTERTPHGLVESAANGFIYTEELAELFSDLKLDHVLPLQEFRKKRFIFRNGLRRWPLSFGETIATAVKFGSRWLFFKKALRPKSKQTVWDWGLKNLGFAATKYLLSPGLQGIYAGEPRQLSAAMILGGLFDGGRRTKYRGTVSFKDGMQAFVDALTEKLKNLGVRIHLNSPQVLSSLAQPTVVCVSAGAVSQAVAGVAPAISQAFASLDMLPVCSVTVFYEKAAEKLQGFGCLFPEDRNFKALGVLSNTFIFENRGPDYSETWIFGGVRSPQVLQMEDLQILHLIQTERKRIFNSAIEFSEYRIHRWPKGLPHYTLELANTLDRIQLPKNLYLHGNYTGGIGLSKILARSKILAEKITLGESYL